MTKRKLNKRIKYKVDALENSAKNRICVIGPLQGTDLYLFELSCRNLVTLLAFMQYLAVCYIRVRHD